MRVDWLTLTEFRSYNTLDWSPDPKVNLLLGPNGAGKTNVLEAIGYLSSLRSFRGVSDGELIGDDSQTAVIRSGVASEERERLIEIQLNRRGARQVQVDKKRPRRSADMLGVMRVVTFLPDDLDLVKRGPSYRRDLIDQIAVQLWPGSYIDQAEYERALRQRNAFLKSGERDETTLSVWDSRLAQTGGRVLARRARTIEAVQSLLTAAYREISSSASETSIGYRTTWGEAGIGGRSAGDYGAELAAALQTSHRADFERRLTTVGPHRDEPAFLLDGNDARIHASQGEQRSVALSVKLAAHRAITDMTGEPPVLLLDDVFSELDVERSDALAGALPADTQTIITSARPDDVPLAGRRWVVDGVLRDE